MILEQVVGHFRILSSLCVFHIEKDQFKKVEQTIFHLPREWEQFEQVLDSFSSLTGPNHVSWTIWLE